MYVCILLTRVNSIIRDSGSRVVVILQNLLPATRWENSPCLGWVRSGQIRWISSGCLRVPDDLLRCPLHSLKRLPVCSPAVATPDGDAAGLQTFDGPSVEGPYNGRVEGGFAHYFLEVHVLLGFIHQGRGVEWPAEVVSDVHPQELGATGSP